MPRQVRGKTRRVDLEQELIYEYVKVEKLTSRRLTCTMYPKCKAKEGSILLLLWYVRDTMRIESEINCEAQSAKHFTVKYQYVRGENL